MQAALTTKARVASVEQWARNEELSLGAGCLYDRKTRIEVSGRMSGYKGARVVCSKKQSNVQLSVQCRQRHRAAADGLSQFLLKVPRSYRVWVRLGED